MKIYVNENQLPLLKEIYDSDLASLASEGYIEVSQLNLDDEFYVWNDSWIAQPFFGFADGDVILKKRGTTHEDYPRLNWHKELVIVGRVWSVLGYLIIAYVIYGDGLRNFGKPSQTTIMNCLKKAASMTDLDYGGKGKYYYNVGVDEEPHFLTESIDTEKQYHPEEKDEFTIGDEGDGNLGYFHVKQEINESITSVVYHFTTMDGLIGILDDDAFHLSYDVDSDMFYMSVTRQRNSQIGYASGKASIHGKIEECIVRITLDGNKFNNRYKGKPFNHFRDEDKNKSNAEINDSQEYVESEERIYSYESYIPNASEYITRIDIIFRKDLNYYVYTYYPNDLEWIIDNDYSQGINVYFDEAKSNTTNNSERSYLYGNKWKFGMSCTDALMLMRDKEFEAYYGEDEEDYLDESKKLNESYGRGDVDYDEVDAIEFSTYCDEDNMHDYISEKLAENCNCKEVVYDEEEQHYTAIDENGQPIKVFNESEYKQFEQEAIKSNCNFDISFYDRDYEYLGDASATLEDLEDYYTYEGVSDELIDLILNEFRKEPNYFDGKYVIREILFNTYSEWDDIYSAAKKLYPIYDEYFEGARGFILQDGTIVATEAEHNEITWLKGVESKFQFIEMGNIRIMPNSIDIGREPTSAQESVLKDMIRCYSDSELYMDLSNEGKNQCGCRYLQPDYRRVIADIDRYYSEGMKPLGEGKVMKKKTIEENFDMEVTPSEVDTDSFEIEDSLEPDLWEDENTLNSSIRLKLLDIADDFIETLNVRWVKPKDILLTGSLCNFNWSEFSDIDLHVLIDFSEVDSHTELVKAYFDAKKNEWNNEHKNLECFGFPVELYVQDLGEGENMSGIYSLEKNKWLKKPNKNDLHNLSDSDIDRVKLISSSIMTKIDDLCDAFDTIDDLHKIEEIGDEAEEISNKLKSMRTNGLEEDGDMAIGNIVYKACRRQGYLDKVWNLIDKVYDRLNSID